ncbi:calcium/proton exchanger, partial [Tanacetum coccineum]
EREIAKSGKSKGSTCTLDVVESDNRYVSFKRMYICFKGVKDGWLTGCRKLLHLLHDDLCLNDGTSITIISDSHKGLIDVVNDWLPEAEHRKCTRHIYANFKKKFSGLQYQRLFWVAASCTLEQQFLQIMDQIKLLDANIKLNKPFQFDKFGTGSTPDKAFDVEE